jgi:hypothetical protein
LTKTKVHKEIVFSIEGVEKFFLRETMETFEVQVISETKAGRIWNLTPKVLRVFFIKIASEQPLFKARRIYQ